MEKVIEIKESSFSKKIELENVHLTSSIVQK